MDESLRYLLREMAANARHMRKALDLTVPQLARRAGVKPGLVKAIESGTAAKLRLSDIDRVAKALGIGAADLMTVADPSPTPVSCDDDRELAAIPPRPESSRRALS